MWSEKAVTEAIASEACLYELAPSTRPRVSVHDHILLGDSKSWLQGKAGAEAIPRRQRGLHVRSSEHSRLAFFALAPKLFGRADNESSAFSSIAYGMHTLLVQCP